jgi:hypothetical protein
VSGGAIPHRARGYHTCAEVAEVGATITAPQIPVNERLSVGPREIRARHDHDDPRRGKDAEVGQPSTCTDCGDRGGFLARPPGQGTLRWRGRQQ